MHEACRSTRIALKVATVAQRVSEPLTCDGQTIVVNRHEHSFGLASRCCEAGCFTVYVRKAVRRMEWYFLTRVLIFIPCLIVAVAVIEVLLDRVEL